MLFIFWVLFDYLSKRYVSQLFATGDMPESSILGLVQLTLVHNTGAAWGIFGDSTMVLAIVSLVVCVAVFVYFLFGSDQACVGEVIGFALIIAGGIGNAVDRFILGYVIDFIQFSFFEFPVFNVADIGVTCGFVILLASMLFSWRRKDASGEQSDTILFNNEDHLA